MTNTSSGRILHIVDADAIVPADGSVLHWRSWAAGEGRSILPLQHECQHETRREFLDWIHTFAEFPVRGKPLRERLALSDGFSAWWLSRLFTRHPEIYGPALFEIFKLRALERYCDEAGFSELVVHVEDARLHAVVSAWCAATGRTCRLMTQKKEENPPPPSPLWKRILKCVLPVARWRRLRGRLDVAFGWWRNERRRFPGRPVCVPGKGLAVGTWFPNLDGRAALAGVFRSRYWEDLHPLLDSLGAPVHWLFVHIGRPEDIPTNRALRDRFRNSQGQGSMTFWEEWVSPLAFARGLRDWLRIAAVAERMENEVEAACAWPIRSLWEESTQGESLLRRRLMREGIRRWAAAIGPQAMGLTSSELQDWERSMFQMLRERGTPALYAAMHSITWPEDTRFFTSDETWGVSEFAGQMPDVFLCNGRRSRELMERGGFPPERLAEAEALRYLYLGGSAGEEVPTGRILLVVTTYFAAEVESQMAVLAEAAAAGVLAQFSDIFLKPHPAFFVKSCLQRHFPGGHPFRLVETPLAELLQPGVVVYSGNSTTAAVEAAYRGLPLAVQDGPDAFNLSPLAGLPGVCFVRTARELAEALQNPSIASIPPDFFFLDAALPRWKALLRRHFPSFSLGEEI